MRRLQNDRGAAMVEAPIGMAIILLIAMGVLTLTQVTWTHMDLSSAVRDATRYATRAEWDPSATTVTSERYRTVGEVKAFAAQAASESGVKPEDVVVTITRDGSTFTANDTEVLQLDDHVTVEIPHQVSNPLYQTAASLTNTAAGLLHIGRPFNEDGVDIKATSTSYVE